ncbi:hypothetical protein Gpo141_00000711 [Globisporangium polare]
MVVYPAYNAIFLSLERTSQLGFVLLLPVIKLSFKFTIAKMYAHDEDLVTAMSSTVDIFDALYTTKCMQSAGTLLVGFGIIAVDLVLNYVAISSLQKRTQRIRDILEAERGTGNAQALKGLLPWMFHLLDKTRRASFQAIDLSKRSRYSLSTQSQAVLSTIELDSGDQPEEMCSSRKVVPLDLKSLGAAMASVNPSEPKPPDADATHLYVLKQCARMLHESEAVAVVEYIETVVPVIYAMYLAILFHMPNAKYYQDMQGFTEHKLCRRFGISIFYQLAFTLENEGVILLCDFAAWVLVIFHFLLVHNGADFTFQFLRN